MPVDPLSKLRELSADELRPILGQLLGAEALPADPELIIDKETT